GVLYGLYVRSLHRPALDEAIKANRAARMIWAEFGEHAREAYRTDVTFGVDADSRGNWLDRLPAMDDDIADMEKLRQAPPAAPKSDPDVAARAMREVLSPAPRLDATSFTGIHTPAKTFVRGKALVVDIRSKRGPKIDRMVLRYRHVNQAESWEAVDITGAAQVEIPAAYTDSNYAMQYHFEVHAAGHAPILYPGLHPGWDGQPYFVVRQSV
ncbi:MAG: hypothetical protein ACRD5L_10870, partial [Bryobacteraceae bacterium]